MAIGGNDVLLSVLNSLQIVGVNVIHGLRHPPDNKIVIEQAEQAVVNKGVERSGIAKLRPNLIQHGLGKAVRPAEFFEIKGMHAHFPQISHWPRAYVPKLDAQKRSGKHEVVAFPHFVDKELCRCYHFRSRLHLVYENERFIRDKRRIGKKGYAGKKVFAVFSRIERLRRTLFFKKIDFDEMLVVLPRKLSDKVRLPDLTRAIDKKRLPGSSLFPIQQLHHCFTLKLWQDESPVPLSNRNCTKRNLNNSAF